MKFLLLEGVHQNALDTLHEGGFVEIDDVRTALPENEIIERIQQINYLGIRSRSQITERIIESAPQLRAIGCFCIGTNQVDVNAARDRGIPVFNAPFANTRSVAELVLAEAVMLMRDIPRKNARAHAGEWLKSASGSFEIRGKHLGIVGYGHIGSQVGLLAESLGMRVFYYDVESKLAYGNATPVRSMSALLETSDVVTLHVPETASTINMIGAEQLAKMRRGAALINASRGSVVDIEALCEALDTGHLCGAALDVFPSEPKSNADLFESPLRRFDNVILTPHVGGSTEEAQQSIGTEVAEKLVRFQKNGSTVSAVNFPEVSLPPHERTYRLLHIHRNQPGVMAQLNQVFSESGINIEAQYLQSSERIGFCIVDFDIGERFDAQKLEQIKRVDGTLRARILNR